MTDAPTTPRAATIPDKPSIDGLEDTWSQVWREQGTYAFDRARALAGPREAAYAIDTPPPTASGSLHVGHVFSYTHTDVVARFQLNTDAANTSNFWAYVCAYMQNGIKGLDPDRAEPRDANDVAPYNIALRLAPRVQWPADMDLESRTAP